MGFDGASEAGRLLRRIRKGAGVSQSSLSRTTGIAVRTIRRIEHGEAADIATYDLIAACFGLPRDWFLRASMYLEPGSAELVGLADLEELVGRMTMQGLLRASTARFVVDLAGYSLVEADDAERLSHGFALQVEIAMTRRGGPR